MILERQKLLMALLSANGGELHRVDFQKLLFLFTRQCEQKPSYEFIPFQKGCYSFTAKADKKSLIKKGFLADIDDWQLTESGKEKTYSVRRDLRQKLEIFSQRRQHLRGESLVASVYRDYPYWAIRSQIAHALLANDAEALAAIENARPMPVYSTLCSLGYEGRSLEGYFNTLLHAGVTLLCDVRKNAFSQKFGFSKATLQAVCKELDIRYEHLPELGIESEARQTLNERSDYENLFLNYEKTVLPSQTYALDQISTWVQSGKCVALTCYERLPEFCHRTCVAHAVEQRIEKKTINL